LSFNERGTRGGATGKSKLRKRIMERMGGRGEWGEEHCPKDHEREVSVFKKMY